MISAIIIAKDEENMISTCLESVKWADEIVVVDNGSTDKTSQIAKKYTNKVYSWSGDGFSALRNYAISKSSGEWVLFVDTDERVLVPLRDEILKLVKDGNYSAYAISRRNIVFGVEQKYGPFWPDWVTRLIKKDAFQGYIGAVHEYPKINGKLGYTKNSLLHLTHRNIDHIVLKSLNWSVIDANLRLEANHPKMSGWRFIRVFILELISQCIKKKGFFSGTIGVMDSLLQTFSLVITYVRLWQLQQSKSREQVYMDLDNKLMSDGFIYK